MAISIREQLLEAITTAVGGEYGIPPPSNEREMPVTIVKDIAEGAEDTEYGFSNITTQVAIGSAASATDIDRDTMRAQANDLLAAIYSAMYDDETFGGLADRVEYSGGIINTELGRFVFAEGQFLVHWHHVRGDPFTID